MIAGIRGAFGAVSRTAWIAIGLIVVLVLLAFGGWKVYSKVVNNEVTAYFPTAKGIYPGDRVLFLGVQVGSIDSITPEPSRVKMKFHYDSAFKVPESAKVVIMSPSLVTARAIQMTPGYSGGPSLKDGAVISQDRTAVPVEWDDFRKQLERVSAAFSPNADNPNGSLGGFIEKAQQALNGQGEQVNSTVTKLADAVSTLNSSRDDIFTTLQGLEKFVTALASSQYQIVAFNGRLASITTSLDNSNMEVSTALTSLDTAIGQLTSFLSENKSKVSTSVAQLAVLGDTLNRSKGYIENLLHTAPTAFGNFVNIYQPAQNVFTGALAFTNFQNPIQFICGAIQAASQMNAADAAKLCVQKLGPLFNLIPRISYPPVGANPFAGVQARPQDLDYSEEWLRRLTSTASSATRAAKPVAAPKTTAPAATPSKQGGR